MIQVTLNPNSALSLYQQLVQHIRCEILTSRLKPGEQLPSVRELAKSTSVNPLTVVKAYAELEQERFIETRWGKGSFVTHSPPARTTRATDKHLEHLADQFIAQALPLARSPEELLSLLKNRLGRARNNLG